MNLTMRVKFTKGEKEYRLGSVKLLDPDLNIGKVIVKGINFDYHCQLSFTPPETAEGRITTLLLGEPILRAGRRKTRKVWELLPLKDLFFVIRGSDDGYLKVDNLPDTGTIYLMLRRRGGEVIKVPFSRWKKLKKLWAFSEPGGW